MEWFDYWWWSSSTFLNKFRKLTKRSGRILLNKVEVELEIK